MFNFDNAQKVTQVMADASKEYLETIFQKLLDKGIDFSKDNPNDLLFAVEAGASIKELLAIILNNDEYATFEAIFHNFVDLDLKYDCKGKIRFEYCSSPDTSSPLFSQIHEVLTGNGFDYNADKLCYTIHLSNK